MNVNGAQTVQPGKAHATGVNAQCCKKGGILPLLWIWWIVEGFWMVTNLCVSSKGRVETTWRMIGEQRSSRDSNG